MRLKMRRIKFRGTSLRRGKTVYGEGLLQTDGRVCIFSSKIGSMAVYPDSVAEFIGYDANNYEVYEGDMMIDESKGKYFTANMSHINEIFKYRKE